MTRTWGFWFSLLMLLSVGCSSKVETPSGEGGVSSGSESGENASMAATTTIDAVHEGTSPATLGIQIDPQRTSSPQQAVEVFLVALLSADEETADAMLTKKAREENARLSQKIAPPGSPTARFEIGDMEYITESPDEDPPKGAHVMSTLTDVYEGETESHDIVWILRNEETGWRVAGMAMRLFEDMDPLILNFEEPAEVQRLTAEAEAEMARRAEQQLR